MTTLGNALFIHAAQTYQLAIGPVFFEQISQIFIVY